jgi:hypothetical protein
VAKKGPPEERRFGKKMEENGSFWGRCPATNFVIMNQQIDISVKQMIQKNRALSAS